MFIYDLQKTALALQALRNSQKASSCCCFFSHHSCIIIFNAANGGVELWHSSLKLYFILLKMLGAGEIAQYLRESVDFAEYWSWILSSHMVTHSHLELQSQGIQCSPWCMPPPGMGVMHRYTCKHSYMLNKCINKSKQNWVLLDYIFLYYLFRSLIYILA